MTDEALKAVERANELLDEVERMREEWERSREIIESAKQMRIAADGYISTLEEANKALAECVNAALEEMERLQKVNKEIARAAEVMAQVSRVREIDRNEEGATVRYKAVKDESRALMVKLAMGVVMSDGAISDSEGEVLKQWVQDEIENYDEDESKRLKQLYTNAMSDAYNSATQDYLEIYPLVSRLKEVAEKKFKLEAIDLCYRVMNADGNIDVAELAVLQKIAKNIGLSPKEIETVRDRNLIAFKGASTSDADPETLLGIDPSWSPIEKTAFLQELFNKWNDRLNNLRDDGDGDDDGGGAGGAGAGSARYQAPSVLDAIGQHPTTDKKKTAP